MRGDAGRHIGEGHLPERPAPAPAISTGTRSRVWSVPTHVGIVAVIGGDDQQIARAQPRQHGRKPASNHSRCRGIAGNVAAVAVEAVELDEVGEDQAPSRLVHEVERCPISAASAPLRTVVDAGMEKMSPILPIGMHGRPPASCTQSSARAPAGRWRSRGGSPVR